MKSWLHIGYKNKMITQIKKIKLNCMKIQIVTIGY
nr:MAG TPA: hypothetical protein [Caudoviricetes sp.]